ncbi:MAG TPA: PqiC family protein [Candidatus Binatia bacterium]
MVFILLGLSLAGCGNLSPRPDPSRFYTLTAIAQPGAAVTEVSSNPGGISLGIGPIRLPGYLDRQEIVTRVSPNRIDLSENDQWAEPLEANFSRVLGQNLAVLLPVGRLVFFPWESTRSPAYQVEVEVLRFEANAAGDVEMSARWVVLETSKKLPLRSGETLLSRQRAVKSTDAAVAALSETLGDLSREIANAISAIEGQRK